MVRRFCLVIVCAVSFCGTSRAWPPNDANDLVAIANAVISNIYDAAYEANVAHGTDLESELSSLFDRLENVPTYYAKWQQMQDLAFAAGYWEADYEYNYDLATSVYNAEGPEYSEMLDWQYQWEWYVIYDPTNYWTNYSFDNLSDYTHSLMIAGYYNGTYYGTYYTPANGTVLEDALEPSENALNAVEIAWLKALSLDVLLDEYENP